jgi:hypothetical protein
MGGKVTDQIYSVSGRSNKIMRAKVVFTHKESAGTALVTCASASGPGIGIAMKLEGCCGG